MKKIFIPSIAFLLIFILTGCTTASGWVPDFSSGFDDYSFETGSVVKSEGKFITSNDTTFLEELALWPIVPKAVKNAKKNDVVCIRKKLSSGLFSWTFFGVRHEKWRGTYAITACGKTSQLEIKGNYSGIMNVGDITFDDFHYFHLPVKDYSPAPLAVARLQAPDGKTYTLYKVEEQKWKLLFAGDPEYAAQNYPHSVPENSCMQIVDEQYRVYADYNPKTRHLILYECSDDEENAAKKLLGAWYAVTDFTEICTRMSEEDED